MPDFRSVRLSVWLWQTDGRTDRQTDNTGNLDTRSNPANKYPSTQTVWLWQTDRHRQHQKHVTRHVIDVGCKNVTSDLIEQGHDLQSMKEMPCDTVIIMALMNRWPTWLIQTKRQLWCKVEGYTLNTLQIFWWNTLTLTVRMPSCSIYPMYVRRDSKSLRTQWLTGRRSSWPVANGFTLKSKAPHPPPPPKTPH